MAVLEILLAFQQRRVRKGNTCSKATIKALMLASVFQVVDVYKLALQMYNYSFQTNATRYSEYSLSQEPG
jgi:hypothetical protein